MRVLSIFLLCASIAGAQFMTVARRPIAEGASTVATPTDSPGAGTYGSTQTVTLSDSTSGATICYTTDGSTPGAATPGTCDSSPTTTYSSGFSVASTTTVKAIGTKAGMTNSGVLTSVYTISGANNVAIISGHYGGTPSAQTAAITFNFSGASVTSGNVVLCGAARYGGSAFTGGSLTKSAGTSTVGTIALDQSTSGGTGIQVGLFRVPITGSGTLTLQLSNDGVEEFMGCAEFSGVHATPLSTTNNTSGSGTTHTTNSITTTDVGVIMYVATEEIGADFTRTLSDTSIFHVDTASNTLTGVVQFKIINSSPNTLTDTTGSESGAWIVSYALYKSN